MVFMNKTLAISVIALVTVVMGFSTVVPIMQAYSSHPDSTGSCPEILHRSNMQWVHRTATPDDPDTNENGFVCDLVERNLSRMVISIIDDIMVV